MADRKKLYMVLSGLILLVAAFLLLYRLNVEAFQDYDEATYAEVTAESLSHGNFLSFTFLDNPYFKKPPLLFWLTSASKELVPNEELALRLPGALATLALIALVMAVCVEMGAGGASALLAGAIITTTSALIEPARQVRFDLLVSLFVVATFYAVVRAQRNPKWYVAAGALLGLAILAKGIIAGFVLVAIGVHLWCNGTRFSFLREKYFWGGVLALLLVALPWHIYETYRFGEAFWDSYVGNEVLARVQMNLFAGTNAPTNAGYVWYLLSFGAPWTELFCIALLALPFAWKRIAPLVRPALLASLITGVSILVVMFLSQTKASSYLIPFYPFMAIALALCITELYRHARRVIRIDIICAVALCFMGGFALTIYNGFHLNPYYAWQTELAREEKIAGLMIHATPGMPAVYEYQYDTIGSIQFYSQLPFTPHPYVLVLSETSEPAAGSLVVTTASSTALVHTFPKLHFTPEYQGADVELFRISS